MPLTDTERDFLDAYVYEATHEPFDGPATTDLRRRGIYYSDLNWILTAFDRELCAQGLPAVGQHNPNPPASPWTGLAHAKCRNEELRQEWEPQISHMSSGQAAAPPARTAEQAVRVVSHDA